MQRTGSFIPTQSKKTPTAGRKIKRIYLLSYVSYVLFFGTLAAVVGLFLYETQLANALENQKSALEAERGSFNQRDLVRVRDMQARIDQATELLSQQAQISRILQDFNTSTPQNVQLAGFTLARTESGYVVMVGGVAQSFDAVVSQDQALAGFEGEITYSIDEVSYNAEALAANEGDGASASVAFPVTFIIKKTIPFASIALSTDAAPTVPVSEPVTEAAPVLDTVPESEAVSTTSIETVDVDPEEVDIEDSNEPTT